MARCDSTDLETWNAARPAAGSCIALNVLHRNDDSSSTAALVVGNSCLVEVREVATSTRVVLIRLDRGHLGGEKINENC